MAFFRLANLSEFFFAFSYFGIGNFWASIVGADAKDFQRSVELRLFSLYN